MRECPACREQIPDDSRFCDQCGFRLDPISLDVHRARSKITPPLDSPVVPLTRVKAPSGAAPGPAASHALEAIPLDTPKRTPTVLPATAPTSPVAAPAPAASPPGVVNTRGCRRFPLKVEVS